MKRFSKSELVDMLVVCNLRSDNGLPCRTCVYHDICNDMYVFYDNCSKNLRKKVDLECQRILFKE